MIIPFCGVILTSDDQESDVSTLAEISSRVPADDGLSHAARLKTGSVPSRPYLKYGIKLDLLYLCQVDYIFICTSSS